jgi:ABC-type glycerol-3-phosphate transport system substrate-binding protein
MRARGWLILLVVAIVAAACGSDDGDNTATPTGGPEGVDAVIELEIADGSLVGGVRRESVSIGDSVQMIVTGDSEDVVHVHGVDEYVELTDGEGELIFDALIPGRFEVELEAAGQLLIELTIS